MNSGMRTGLVVVMLMVSICSLFAQQQDALSAFSFDPQKMDVGTCYEYSLSDQKQTKVMSFYVYVKSTDNILVYKDYSTIEPMVLHLDEKFNWDYMMFHETYLVNPFWEYHLPGMNKEAFAKWDYVNKRLPITMVYFDSKGREKKQAMSIQAAMLPAYDFSLYHLDLFFAIRHLKDDSKPLTLGGFYAGYYIQSTMSFKRIEEMDGRLCKLYEIKGQGLMSLIYKANQRLWIPVDDPLNRPIRYENDMKISPFKDILVVLKSEKKMSLADWESMVAGFDRQAKIRLGL